MGLSEVSPVRPWRRGWGRVGGGGSRPVCGWTGCCDPEGRWGSPSAAFALGRALPPRPPPPRTSPDSGASPCAAACWAPASGARRPRPPPLVVSLRTDCLTPAVAQGPQDLWQSFLACPPGGNWGVVRLPFEGFQRTWGGRLVEEESGAGMGTHKVAGLSFAMVLDGRDKAAARCSPEPEEGLALEPAGAQGGHAPPREPREAVPSTGGEFALEVDWVRAVREDVDPEACDEHGEPSPSGWAESGRAA